MTRNFELSLEPPIESCDNSGAVKCGCCGYTIPAAAFCYNINGIYYCEDCIEQSKTVAPYKGEIDEW